MLADRYRIDAPLGTGGMGTVYLATQLDTGRRVAVKLGRCFGPARSTSDALASEGLLLQSVASPWTVALLDFGVDPPCAAFLVLELVSGGTLADRIREEGPLCPRRAVDLACDVLEALAVVHDKGLVHRDVKSDNILVERQGAREHAKLSDLGIACPLSEAQAGHGRQVYGTPSYLSPEQARGDGVDHRADLYAVGIVLYEALSGAPPFRREAVAALLFDHLQREPPPLQGKLSIPPGLVAEVHRALAKDPAERQPTARAMQRALRAALG